MRVPECLALGVSGDFGVLGCLRFWGCVGFTVQGCLTHVQELTGRRLVPAPPWGAGSASTGAKQRPSPAYAPGNCGRRPDPLMRHASSLFCPVLWTSVAPFCGSTTASFPRTQAERSFSAGLSLSPFQEVRRLDARLGPALMRTWSCKVYCVCAAFAAPLSVSNWRLRRRPALRKVFRSLLAGHGARWCDKRTSAARGRGPRKKKRVVRSGLRGGRGSPPQQSMLLCLFAAALG